MLNRVTYKFTLDLRRPTINRLKVVNGDTANTFEITIKDAGAAITLDPDLHKVIAVFERADGQIYTQDASTGLSFTAAGVVTIDVRPASFRTGTNTVKLQIYKRESSTDEEYPLLLTTYEQVFTARMEAIPEAGAPNAPSQLPMLEGLIEDAGNAVDACEAATAAANEAASAANTAAAAATAAATDADNAANAAWIRVDACNIALANVLTATDAANQAASSANAAAAAANDAVNAATEAALAADRAARNADAKAEEAETAAQGANTAAAAANAAAAAATAAAAAAAKKNVYLVKYVESSWDDDDYFASTVDGAAVLSEIMTDALFASYVTLPSGERAAVYEYYRDESGVFLRSDLVGDQYVTAYLDTAGEEISFKLRAADTPLELHITGTQEVQGSGGRTYRTVTFATGDLDKLQAFAKTRAMSCMIQDWTASDAQFVLNKTRVRDDGTNLEVLFYGMRPNGIGNEATGTVTGLEGIAVTVYFANGVYHSAVATRFTKTF